MGKALYRKYRSEDFDEVIGQDHVTTILSNSLKSGKYSHAYLLSGPRGVGKTSVARIFARELNSLKKKDKAYYPDIIEIDAASNRRIEEIRELRDKIRISPNQLKYKVYIVDEVHMLTKEAFNALLKTLEEPPAHAIFILATTDAHKVPETIKSRCINLNFRLIPSKEIIKHLKNIAKTENIEITDGGLRQVAEHSEGSLRDAITILDQLSNLGQKIDEIAIQAMLGTITEESITSIFDSISNQNISNIFILVQDLVDQGATVEMIVKQLSSYLREDLANKANKGLQIDNNLALMDNLAVVLNYKNPRLGLEIALSKAALINQKNQKDDSDFDHQAIELNDHLQQESEPVLGNTQNLTSPTLVPTVNINNNDQLWQDVLATLKNKNSALYGIARMADPILSENNLILKFKFPFHYKQMNLDKNKSYLNKTLLELKTNIDSIKLEMIDEANKNSSHNNENSDHKKAISNISNIFGSAELLE